MTSITSSSAFTSSLSLTESLHQTVRRLQGDLGNAQTELVTGKLTDPGLVLGARSGAIAALNARHASLQTLIDTNALATTRLDASQAAIDTALSGAQGVLKALISESGVAAIPSIAGGEANAALKTLTGALNTTVEGNFVFGGINTGQKPIADYPGTPPSAAKLAFDAAFQANFGFPTSDPAAASVTPAALGSFIDTTFSALFDPGPFSANISSASDTVPEARISETERAETGASANAGGFRALISAYTLVSEFSTGTFSAAAYKTVLDRATTKIAAATPALTDVATTLGLSQQRISTASDRLKLQQGGVVEALGSLQDVDSYASSARISALTTQIETAYSLTAKLQKLSLLDYL